MGRIAKRLEELGITLPIALDPSAYGFQFLTAVLEGDLLYLSGNADLAFRGKVGSDLTVEEGSEASRGAALQCLAVMKKELGTLDRVKKILRVLGFVNSAPGFSGQAVVLDGCSDLLVEVFGERGKHARSAVGTGALPMGFSVEIEMLVVVGRVADEGGEADAFA